MSIYDQFTAPAPTNWDAYYVVTLDSYFLAKGGKTTLDANKAKLYKKRSAAMGAVTRYCKGLPAKIKTLGEVT